MARGGGSLVAGTRGVSLPEESASSGFWASASSEEAPGIQDSPFLPGLFPEGSCSSRPFRATAPPSGCCKPADRSAKDCPNEKSASRGIFPTAIARQAAVASTAAHRLKACFPALAIRITQSTLCGERGEYAALSPLGEAKSPALRWDGGGRGCRYSKGYRSLPKKKRATVPGPEWLPITAPTGLTIKFSQPMRRRIMAFSFSTSSKQSPWLMKII